MANEARRLQFTKLKLKGQLDGKPIQLTWGTREGYPRVTVFLPEEQGKSLYDRMIIIPFNTTSLITFLSAIEKVLEDKDAYIEVVSLNTKWDNVNNKRTDEKIVAGKITVKRDDIGKIVFVIEAENKPIVTFPIEPDYEWVDFFYKGKKINNTVAGSVLFTRSYIKTLINVLTMTIVDDAMKSEELKTNSNNGTNINEPTL